MSNRAFRVTLVPFTPTPDQQRAALCHVREEMDAVLRILATLQAAPASDDLLRAAMLERLAVHLRTLRTFLESRSRSVHYSSGIRQENDDVLAADYGFPTRPLPISDADRKDLDRPDRPLSYSGQHLDRVDRRLDLLALSVPVLRGCASFAAHALTTSFLHGGSRDQWEDLLRRLHPFAAPGSDPGPRTHSGTP